MSAETVFLIVYTLIFKALWTESFNQGKSQEFTKLNGNKVVIPMITRNSKEQVVAQFTTELFRTHQISSTSSSGIALAIPYEV